jgi:hypothetical protein
MSVDVYGEEHMSDALNEEDVVEVQTEEDVMEHVNEEITDEKGSDEVIREEMDVGSHTEEETGKEVTEDIVDETPVEEDTVEPGSEDVPVETEFQKSFSEERNTESFSDVLARDFFTNINFSVKITQMNFIDDYVKERVPSAAYYAIDGYTKVYRNLYAGIEVGYAGGMGDKDNETIDFSFYNLQGNAKYAFDLFRDVQIDVGAGLSLIYVYDDGDVDTLDRMGGFQVFSDLNWYGEPVDDSGRFFIGLNAKYQQPAWKVDYDWEYTNWQIGGHLGFMWE